MNWLCSNGRVRRVVSVALLLVMVATVFPTAAFAAVSTKDAYYMEIPAAAQAEGILVAVVPVAARREDCSAAGTRMKAIS